MPPSPVRPVFQITIPLLLGATSGIGQVKTDSLPDFGKIAPLLEQYCHKCHDAETRKGDLRLDIYGTTASVIRDRKTWLKVLEQLETREMPTKDPLPNEAEYETMIHWVDAAVNRLDWDAIKHPGHVTLPRLTKTEYNRTIRDLLGLDSRAGRTFSEDGEGKSGFTNDRDALFITASQMEKYFEAAENAVDAIMTLAGDPYRRKFEAEEMFMTETGSRPAPVDDDGAVGYILNRGQMTLYESIDLPGDGFYRFKVRARSTTDGPTGGVLRINDVLTGEIRIAGRDPEVKEIVTFLPGGSHQMAWNIKIQPQASRPRGSGKSKGPRNFTKVPNDANDIVGRESKKNAPRIPRTGRESADVKRLVDRWDGTQVGVQRPYEWLRLHGPRGNPAELSRFHGYVTERSQELPELERDIAEGLGIAVGDLRRRIGDANRKTMADRERLLETAKVQVVREARPGQFAVDWIEIEGPLPVGDPELARRSAALFSDQQDWLDGFSRLVRRAFRRPVSDGEIGKFLEVHENAREAGREHGEAMRQTIVAVLVSPHFLYRIERGEGEEFALDDWQLASRLSYFLWQTMPDDDLFSLAEKGELRNRLGPQIDRMLSDEKAAVFYESFPGQWLGYSGLGRTIRPDARKFRAFTPELAAAMKTETNRLFETVFRENRPLSDLLTSRETFLNEALAKHYGIDGVKGNDFRKVALTTDQRGGILGMGSVLTATSTPVRTSPVIRGVWVMERLLGEDPGEPLADAGELPGNAGEARGKTQREELELHRDRPECASCHDKIDPLGFGLEQFDAIGRFRIREGKKPIDATGEFPDGTKFTGVAELRDYLVTRRRDQFHRVAVEQLLSYALGRELRTADEAAIREILRRGEETEFRAADLVKSVAESYPFLNQAADDSEF